MRNHVIIATDLLPDLPPAPLHYFAGYLDWGDTFEPIWTFDPRRARWIDDAEVAIELALLAGICPGTFLKSWSSVAVGSRKAS
jgi:hypothetical protein